MTGISAPEGQKPDEKRDQQKEMLVALSSLLSSFDEYELPIVRADGDIVIPLNPVLKKNRAAFKGLASAFSEMMKQDVQPRRSRTWVD